MLTEKQIEKRTPLANHFLYVERNPNIRPGGTHEQRESHLIRHRGTGQLFSILLETHRGIPGVPGAIRYSVASRAPGNIVVSAQVVKRMGALLELEAFKHEGKWYFKKRVPPTAP